MTERILDAERTLARFQPYDRAQVRGRLMQALSGWQDKIVVLDDDPTGVQTVHDVYVYTDWRPESLRAAFEAPERMFFVLTNSRSMSEEETQRVHQQIARAVAAAAQAAGRDFVLISRGDSTLRGHYPLETQTLREELERETGRPYDGEILLPFFLEGGRYTVDDVHYVRMGDRLVPAGQTGVARDKPFGYESSNLRAWIQEKTRGACAAERVASIGLETLRRCDYAAVVEQLMGLSGFERAIANAVDDADVEVFATALIEAIRRGKRFLFRSAAALPKALGGVSDRPLLTREELTDAQNPHGGLIVVGSHVERTTRQLQALRRAAFVEFVEFNQHLVTDEAAFEAEQRRVVAQAQAAICAGRTVAVYTRRERFDLGTGDREAELRLSVRISQAVTGIVERLTARPAFIVAKGGITSSDIGTKALRVRRALVLGQILKGVPVWLTDEESKFPRMPYVIFPGNVGDDEALYDAVVKLQRDHREDVTVDAV